MPSEKTARASDRKRVRNRRVRSAARTFMTKAMNTLRAGELQPVEQAVTQVVSALDKAVTKGVIHRNNAARKKSRLVAKLNVLKTASAT